MNNAELNDVIAKASKAVAHDWQGVIEADDLQQELWIRLLESDKAMFEIGKSDPALRVDLLKRMAVQIASRYANDYELFSGNSFYGTDHVRKLLEAGLLTVARRDLGEMNETLTEFLDLHGAFDHMKTSNSEYARIIWDFYVVDDYDTGTGARYERLRRSVNTLTDKMNQAHRRRHAEYEEGPGTREIVSNEKARLIAQRQYTGKGEGYNTFAQ